MSQTEPQREREETAELRIRPTNDKGRERSIYNRILVREHPLNKTKRKERHRTYDAGGDELGGEHGGEADGQPHVEYPHEVLGACEADDGETGRLQQEHGHPREKKRWNGCPPRLANRTRTEALQEIGILAPGFGHQGTQLSVCECSCVMKGIVQVRTQAQPFTGISTSTSGQDPEQV